jgi:hypothetical protein
MLGVGIVMTKWNNDLHHLKRRLSVKIEVHCYLVRDSLHLHVLSRYDRG